MTEYLNALLLGIVEGLTEFLPISSTGHLILVGDILGFSGPPGRVFEIAIQFGAILAVCWLYRQKLWATATGMFRRGAEQRFACNILLSFLPAAVLGVLFHEVITDALFSVTTVAVMLVVGGFAILAIERFKPAPTTYSTDAISWKTALAIGFCQALAMVPGVSRSGATIMGALMLRMERTVAAEYSFFLAIPTMLAATVFSVAKHHEAFADTTQLMQVGVGFVAAFVVALMVVKWAIAFISKHGFKPFAYYRIVIGLVILTFVTL